MVTYQYVQLNEQALHAWPQDIHLLGVIVPEASGDDYSYVMWYKRSGEFIKSEFIHDVCLEESTD
jgi:hypothetical protein